MDTGLTFRRLVLALTFALLITPLYFTAWWFNEQALVPVSHEPPPRPGFNEIIVDNLTLVMLLGAAISAATIIVLLLLKNQRHWRLIIGLWFWSVSVVSPFLLRPLAKPWLLGNITPGAFLADLIITLFTAFIPSIVGILVMIIWLLVSSMIAI